jgi:hypothetical protein
MDASEAVALFPASMLMALPPEVRLQIYQFIDPRYNLPSRYAGVLRTCRQFRKEFEHEVSKDVRRHYSQELPSLQATGSLTIRPQISTGYARCVHTRRTHNTAKLVLRRLLSFDIPILLF